MCKVKTMMFIVLWIFGITSFGVQAGPSPDVDASSHTITTCEEFEIGARFNPYEIVDSMWKIIYFWSETTEIRPIIFSLVENKRLNRFKAVVDAIYPNLGVEWNKATLMMEPRPGLQLLLMDSGTPGAFRALIKMEQRDKVKPQPEPLIKFAELRLKLKETYLGMMCCEDLSAFVLVRIHDVPTTEEECVAAGATLGLRGPGGKSYLYVQNYTRSEL